MIINHNLAAMNTYRQYSTNNNAASKSLEKLSSGLRINSAADDAAGLAISEKMRSQIRGLDQASSNAQDAISLVQTAEGALSETESILQRMRELSVQAASDTNTTTDRSEIQKEINQLTSEINRIGNTTEFNTQKLLNGDKSKTTTVTKLGTEVLAVSKTYNPAYAEGVTWSSGQAAITIKNASGNSNSITFSGSAGNFDWSKLAASSSSPSANLVITREGSDITVSFSGEDTDGDTLTINQEKMAFNSTTNEFTYDANGITFSVSKTEFDKLTDGNKVTVDLKTYGTSGTADLTAASVNTKTDFTSQTVASGGIAGGFTSAGITISSKDADFLKNVTSIRITGSNLQATGVSNYKVELLNASGVAVVTEDFGTASGAAAGDLVYDQHGIKFTFEANDTESFAITQKLDTASTAITTSTVVDKSATFQIGANTSQYMIVDISDMRANALGISATASGATKDVLDSAGLTVTASYISTSKDVTNGSNSEGTEYALDISSATKASAAVTVIDEAIANVSSERSKLGAAQNRLEHTINNLGTSSENLTSAESRIRDVDMAKEMMNYQKTSILQQAAQAMLAQANQQPQGVLKLLQ